MITLVNMWLELNPTVKVCAPLKPLLYHYHFLRITTKLPRWEFLWYRILFLLLMGGVVALWLGRSFLDQVIPVWALAGGNNTIILFCSWPRNVTLAVPPSTQIYKWVLARLMLGGTLLLTRIPSTGGKITLVSPCYKKVPPWWATWLVCRLYLSLSCCRLREP